MAKRKRDVDSRQRAERATDREAGRDPEVKRARNVAETAAQTEVRRANMARVGSTRY